MEEQRALRWERCDRGWRAEFRSRLQAMRQFFAGLNPDLSEEEALRELLEEAEFMLAPLHVRLAEIEAAKGVRNGSGS